MFFTFRHFHTERSSVHPKNDNFSPISASYFPNFSARSYFLLRTRNYRWIGSPNWSPVDMPPLDSDRAVCTHCPAQLGDISVSKGRSNLWCHQSGDFLSSYDFEGLRYKKRTQIQRLRGLLWCALTHFCYPGPSTLPHVHISHRNYAIYRIRAVRNTR